MVAASKPLVVVVGTSQSGKSTLISLLTDGAAKPEVGENGRGRSATIEPKVYESIIAYDLVDCPGHDDSKRRFNGRACGKMIADAVIKFQKGKDNVNRKCIFLVTDSLTDGTVRLGPTLSWLKTSFGEDSLKATVVLATKADELDLLCKYHQDRRKNRLDELDRSVKHFLRHNRYLLWRSEEEGEELEPSHPIMKRQLEALQQKLREAPAVEVDTLKEFQDKINQRAQVLLEESKVTRHVLEVVRDDSPSMAVGGAGVGVAVGGAVGYFAALEAAAAATPWYAVAPAAVALHPMVAGAAAGALVLGVTGFLVGQATKLSRWKTHEWYSISKQKCLDQAAAEIAEDNASP